MKQIKKLYEDGTRLRAPIVITDKDLYFAADKCITKLKRKVRNRNILIGVGLFIAVAACSDLLKKPQLMVNKQKSNENGVSIYVNISKNRFEDEENETE